MKYEITKHGDLEISTSYAEQHDLQKAMKEDETFQTDDFMYNLFESLVANSELTWIAPEDIGALTDAPILGICGRDRTWDGKESLTYTRTVGHSGKYPIIQTIEKAWAFMDYQVRSVQQDLAEQGNVIF